MNILKNRKKTRTYLELCMLRYTSWKWMAFGILNMCLK